MYCIYYYAFRSLVFDVPSNPFLGILETLNKDLHSFQEFSKEFFFK